jgi:hypothetical protein
MAVHKPSHARDAEIIRDIVKALEPWKPQWRELKTGWPIKADGTLPPGSWVEAMIVQKRLVAIPADKQAKAWVAKQEKDKLRTEIPAAVGTQIEHLRKVNPEFFSRAAVRNTRDEARLLLRAIKIFEGRIAQATPELRVRLKLDLQQEEFGTQRLFRELKHLRDECNAAVQGASGTNQLKEQCARTAISLIVMYSDRKPHSGSAESAYRKIAGLLYEAVTDKPPGRDNLKRPCDAVLREYRKVLYVGKASRIASVVEPIASPK